MLKVEVPRVFLGTQGFSAHRDGRYPHPRTKPPSLLLRDFQNDPTSLLGGCWAFGINSAACQRTLGDPEDNLDFGDCRDGLQNVPMGSGSMLPWDSSLQGAMLSESSATLKVLEVLKFNFAGILPSFSAMSLARFH